MLFASLLAFAATAAAAPSLTPKALQPFNPPKADGFTSEKAVQQWIGDVNLAGNTYAMVPQCDAFCADFEIEPSATSS